MVSRSPTTPTFKSLGPRGELSFATSSGGGIDLRRLPATSIERVEVIRGIPSARFGDLTQGTVLVDTRAGTIDPEVLARLDARTVEASLVGGSDLFRSHTGSARLNLARTRVAPRQTDHQSWRITGQLAHRYERGRLRLDSRIDGFQLVEDRPESELFPGLESRSRDNGLRLGERARLDLGGPARLELTAGERLFLSAGGSVAANGATTSIPDPSARSPVYRFYYAPEFGLYATTLVRSRVRCSRGIGLPKLRRCGSPGEPSA